MRFRKKCRPLFTMSSAIANRFFNFPQSFRNIPSLFSCFPLRVFAISATSTNLSKFNTNKRGNDETRYGCSFHVYYNFRRLCFRFWSRWLRSPRFRSWGPSPTSTAATSSPLPALPTPSTTTASSTSPPRLVIGKTKTPGLLSGFCFLALSD